MQKRVLFVAIVCAFGGSYLAKLLLLNATQIAPPALPVATPARIVSLAPSATEVLFDLGLGDRVVGVTRFCDYPPEAKQKTDIGGFLDPDYEAILALKPDLAVVLSIHDVAAKRLGELGIRTLVLEHRTFDGVLESIQLVGDSCGAGPKAAEALGTIRHRLAVMQIRMQDVKRPRVLISSGRSYGTGSIGEVYVAGRNEWYDDIIQRAGGVNAYQDEGVQFPNVAGEGLLRLDPEVIIELVPPESMKGSTPEAIIAEWNALPTLKAVQNKRVFVLSNDYVSIPGPRFIDTLEDVARILHPEIDWNAP